jgi:ectoine hydroxylase-related dioxygenase (phytanoyl-CoA dioxygenase family)
MDDIRRGRYLEEYEAQGYAIVRGVFARDEVAEMAASFDRIYAQGLAYGASYRDKNTFFRLGADKNIGNIVRMVQWPSYFDATLAKYRIDARLCQILAPLLSRNMKQIINQLHWKPPGAAGVEFGYHQDVRFRRPREAYRGLPQSYVQTGIAIDPHSAANGAMTIYPGSHRLGELAFNAQGRIMNQIATTEQFEALGLDPKKLVSVDLAPGDVAMWNLFTVHGSGRNTSQIDRRFYLNGYVTADKCDRGEWAFRDGAPVALGEPVLVHYEDLYKRPDPHFIEVEQP